MDEMKQDVSGNIAVAFRLNGEAVRVTVPSNTTLLQVLRNHLQKTGTKEGCGTGECGACTVVIEGRPALACVTLAGSVEGKEIFTIEAAAAGGELLLALQQSFLETGAVQCGFCSPGMIMSSWALLKKNGAPSADEIREAIGGNICRCTGYHKIVQAVENTARRRQEETR